MATPTTDDVTATNKRWSEGTPQVNFRAGDLAAPLQERAGADTYPLSYVAKRDLERLYAVLAEDLRELQRPESEEPAGDPVRLHLSEAEALLLCDACNGVLHEPYTISWLVYGVADAIRNDGLAAKWHVDGESLLARLHRLSPLQCLALIDAIERAWRLPDGDLAAAMRRVGLVAQEAEQG